MVSSLSLFSVVAALLAPAFAQSSCNPTKGACSPDPALGKAVFYDFTKGTSSDWSLSTGAAPTFDSDGAKFTIAKHLDSPTLSSKWYIMYGHYDIVTQIAPGQGVVSSAVLMSDDKDEVDLEWVGNQKDSLQCNYFGQGNEGSEKTVTVSNPSGSFHTYSIDWTPDALTWAVDGTVLRLVSSSESHFPQTPSVLKLGIWPGGDPSEQSGTIAWAGGPINYTAGPYTMTVKSVTVYDYSTGTSYAYGDTSGNADSISSNGGKIGAFSNTNGMSVSTAVMGGATPTSASSTAAPTSTPVSSTSAAATPTTTTAAVASSLSASSAAAGSTPSASASSPSAPAQSPSSASIPFHPPAPSTLTTLVQTVTPPAGGQPVPTTVISTVPVATPTSGSGSGSGSGTGTGGSGGGSGSGTSDIPPPIQSEIAAIGAKNPFLGQLLEGIWNWIEAMVHRQGNSNGRKW